MSDFESEYCGWDSDYSEWQTDGQCVSAANEKCDECGHVVVAGQEHHKWLFSDGGDHEDLEEGTLDWDNNMIAIEDHGEMLDDVVVVRNVPLSQHLMCESCDDLYDSLIANGRQPQLSTIHHCHDDWKNHVKAEELDKRLSPLIRDINQLLKGTILKDKAGDLECARYELVESVRNGE